MADKTLKIVLEFPLNRAGTEDIKEIEERIFEDESLINQLLEGSFNATVEIVDEPYKFRPASMAILGEDAQD